MRGGKYLKLEVMDVNSLLQCPICTSIGPMMFAMKRSVHDFRRLRLDILYLFIKIDYTL